MVYTNSKEAAKEVHSFGYYLRTGSDPAKREKDLLPLGFERRADFPPAASK